MTYTGLVPDPAIMTNIEGDWFALRRARKAAERDLVKARAYLAAHPEDEFLARRLAIIDKP